MTNREFFAAVSAGTINEDVIAHAANELKKLDERNAKRSSKPSKTALENAPIKAAIMANCKENEGVARPAADIGAAVGITTSKASALLRQLAESGNVTASEGKVKGKGKVKFYQFSADLPTEDESEGEDENTESEGGEDAAE